MTTNVNLKTDFTEVQKPEQPNAFYVPTVIVGGLLGGLLGGVLREWYQYSVFKGHTWTEIKDLFVTNYVNQPITIGATLGVLVALGYLYANSQEQCIPDYLTIDPTTVKKTQKIVGNKTTEIWTAKTLTGGAATLEGELIKTDTQLLAQQKICINIQKA